MVFEVGLCVMKHLHFAINSSRSLLKGYCFLEYEVMYCRKVLVFKRNLLLACSFPPKCCYPSTRIHITTCRKPVIIACTVTISPDFTVCVKVTALLQHWQSYAGTQVTNYSSQAVPGGLYSPAFEHTGGKITMCGVWGE